MTFVLNPPGNFTGAKITPAMAATPSTEIPEGGDLRSIEEVQRERVLNSPLNSFLDVMKKGTR
jgi:hypothetical protein